MRVGGFLMSLNEPSLPCGTSVMKRSAHPSLVLFYVFCASFLSSSSWNVHPVDSHAHAHVRILYTFAHLRRHRHPPRQECERGRPQLPSRGCVPYCVVCTAAYCLMRKKVFLRADCLCTGYYVGASSCCAVWACAYECSTCTRARANTHKRKQTRAHTHAHAHTHIHTYTYTHTHTYKQTNTHTHARTHAHTPTHRPGQDLAGLHGERRLFSQVCPHAHFEL